MSVNKSPAPVEFSHFPLRERMFFEDVASSGTPHLPLDPTPSTFCSDVALSLCVCVCVCVCMCVCVCVCVCVFIKSRDHRK